MESRSGPRQRIPGTRRHRYRCSLPGLAGFTVGRRGEADADRPRLWPLGGVDTTRASEFPRQFHEQVAPVERQDNDRLALLNAALAQEKHQYGQRQEEQERQLVAQQVAIEP